MRVLEATVSQQQQQINGVEAERKDAELAEHAPSSEAETTRRPLGRTATSRTLLACPRSVVTKFQVPAVGCHTLIVRSAAPVTNQSLVGSTAMQRTHPR